MNRDRFGVDACELRSKKLFLLDMDGTIYQEDRLFEGTQAFLDKISEMGGRYVFITNNSSKSAADYIAKVRRMGIDAGMAHFFTSAQASIQLLKQKHPGQIVYCQGTQSLLSELREAGILVTDRVQDDIGVVLVGYDTELTSRKLRNTCEILLRDLPYYATNLDLTCPVSFGFVPDCGSMCIMLENATGKKPVVIGKPEPTMIDIVRDKFGVSREDTVVIGDRLYTDIAAGNNAGVTSVCVLSGEASFDDVVRSAVKPSYTFDSVREVLACLDGRPAQGPLPKQ